MRGNRHGREQPERTLAASGWDSGSPQTTAGRDGPPPAAPPERRERPVAPRRRAGLGVAGARPAVRAASSLGTSPSCGGGGVVLGRQPAHPARLLRLVFPKEKGKAAPPPPWTFRSRFQPRLVWICCPYGAGARATAGCCERSSTSPVTRKGETKLGMPNTFKFSRRFYSPSLGFLKQMIRKMTRKTTVPQPTAMRMTRYRGR